MRQVIGLFSLILLFQVMPGITGGWHHAAQAVLLPERIAQNTLPSPEPLPPSLVSPTSTADPIATVVAAGLMTRDANGSFQAERALTRAQLASILVRTFQLEKRITDLQGTIALQDVPPSHWAYDDIQIALRTRTMEGDRPGVFSPNRTMNRAEGFAIFAQAYGVFQFDNVTIVEILKTYPDSANIPSWFRKSIATALNEGFVNVTNNRINPTATMTRGDMAYALARYLQQKRPPAYVDR